MQDRLWLLGVILLGLSMLSGCQRLPSGQTTATKPVPTLPPLAASPSFRAVPLPGGQSKTTPEVPLMNEVPLSTPFDRYVDEQVSQAKADLAKRLSIDPAQVELVSASSVTWPDGSLGCPQPGMVYTQALVDGLRVQLRANGRLYDYHGGGGKPLFLCEQRGS